MAAFFLSVLLIALEIKMVKLVENAMCQDVLILNAADIAQPAAPNNNLLINAEAAPHSLPCSGRILHSTGSPTTRQQIVLSAASEIHLKIIRGSSLVLHFANPASRLLCHFSGDSLISNRHSQTVVICSPYWTHTTNCSCYVVLSVQYFSPEQPCVEMVIYNQLTSANMSLEERDRATLIVQAFTAVGSTQCGPRNQTDLIQYYRTWFTLKPGEYVVRKVNEIKDVKFFYKSSVDRNGLPYADPCSIVVPKLFLDGDLDNQSNEHYLVANSSLSQDTDSVAPCPVTFDRQIVNFVPIRTKCVVLLIGSMGPTDDYVMTVLLSNSNVCYNNLEHARLANNQSELSPIFGPLKTGNYIFAEALVDQPVSVLFKDGLSSTTTVCYELLDLEPFANIGRQSFVHMKCSYEKQDEFRCTCELSVD